MKFDTFIHDLLTKRDKLGDHWCNASVATQKLQILLKYAVFHQKR
jgi:hypothetical protein